MFQWKACLIAVAATFSVSCATAQESTPRVTQEVPEVTGIKTEIITIPDPHAIRKADPLVAILYTPEGGINMYSPAIVMIHGGLAGHPARQVGAPRFAAERLAKMGYTVLSPMTRHSRDEFQSNFEDIVYDIDTSIDALEARGIQRFVLAGHSMGSVRIAYYQAETQDPRVKALIHYAPTADMGGEGGVAQRFIPDYEAKVAAAQAAVDRGEGRMGFASKRPGEAGLETEVVINAVAGYFYGPEAFLSHWGPDTKARNSDVFPNNTVPILMMAGTYDIAVPPGRMERLKGLATKSPRVDHITYENVNHFFEKAWDESSNDTAEWLAEIGLAPEQRVSFEIIDTRMANGRHLPGILYKPETIDPSKPAFVLHHGWTGDILHSSPHWLGQRLARAGYVVLTPQTRISGTRGAYTTRLAESAADLGKWMDAMEERGFNRLIVEGHSMGGLWMSNYISTSQDPRIIGAVYLAPTRDLPDYLKEGVGEEKYAELYEEAKASDDAGNGLNDFIFYRFRRPNVDQETGPVSATLQLTRQFMEYHGPNTRGVHTERVKEFTLPGLAIAGRKDALMTEKFIGEFEAAYAGDLKVIWYEDGSHRLTESKEHVTKDILDWVNAQF